MAVLDRAAYWKALCLFQEENIFGFIYSPSPFIFLCIEATLHSGPVLPWTLG